MRRRLGAALAVAGLTAVLAATLTPVHDLLGTAQQTPLTCLVCGPEGGADVAANLLLMLPLAIGLRVTGVSWRRTVVAGGLLSLTIELLQLWVVPGRDASLSDVLSNTASAAIGAAIGAALPKLARPGPELARRLLAVAVPTLLLLLTASAWLLQPRAPHGTLVSRWAHVAPGIDAFPGRVRAVRLDGQPMPGDGAPSDSAGFRGRLDRGEFALEADILSGRPTSDRLWVYTLRVPPTGGLTLSQFRREAGVDIPVRAQDFRLGPLSISLSNAFPIEPGVPVHLTARAEGGRVRLTSAYGGTERSVELGLSPAYGWRVLAPFELASGGRVRWVTALGLAGVLLPLGLWARATGRPAVSLGTLAAAIVTGLGALPAVAGFPPSHWSEWAGSVLGVATGWALPRFAAYLQGRCASPSASDSSSS